MNLETMTDWIAWGGIVLPLIVTAVSVYLFVRLEIKKQKTVKYDHFYKLMDQIGMEGGSIPSKMAAIAELKKYPEYKNVIVRLCLDLRMEGTVAWLLEREFGLTAKHFGAEREENEKE